MSTILKALKRLEEDQPTPSRNAANAPGSAARSGEASAGAAAGAPTRASDPLRERLLAEEALAEATAAAAAEERRVMTPLLAGRGPLLAASVAALVLVCGVIGYSISGDRPGRDAASPSTATTTATTTDPATSIARATAPAPPPDTTAVAAPAARTLDAPGAAPRPDPSVPPPGSSRATAPVAAVAIPTATSSSSNGSGVPAVSPPSPSPPTSRTAARPMQATPSVAVALEPEAIVRPTRSAAATDPLPANAARRPIDPSDDVATHASQTASPAIPSASTRDSSSLSASRPRANPPAPPRARPPAVAAARPPRATPSADARRSPEPGQTRVAEGPSRASARATPQPERTARSTPPSTSDASSVERIDRTSLPDVSVVRTAWHPKPDRRSARVRLEDSGEIRLLKEGDAIGRLVLKEITPSAVLFSAGDVEIRRRVGDASSGGR